MDFIKISYTAKVKDGNVFDTTDEKKAKENNIYSEKRVYKPLVVVPGEEMVVAGLDEVLKDLKVGEKKTVEVPPEKGFGVRDPAMVRLVPMSVFKKERMTPVPGMPVEIDGRPARVQTVAGGRVRLDFNHELAGKTLVYDVKVESKADSPEDKAKYLVERSFNDSEGFNVKVSGKKISVEIPEKAYRDRSLLVRKASLAAESFKYLGLEGIDFIESWKNPKAEEKKEKTEEKKEKKGK